MSLAAAFALGSPELAHSDSTTPDPLTSAPSEYVEVVPTAGGGAPTRAGSSERAGQPSAPDSAVGAAADAVTSGDSSGPLAFGAVMVAVTLVLVGATAWQRRARRGERHVPKG
jgi:hypothetical protein